MPVLPVLKVMVLMTLVGCSPGVFAEEDRGDSENKRAVKGNSDPIDPDDPVVASMGQLQFRECNIEAEGRDRLVECAWLEVPENYAEPQAKKISLFVARLPAKKRSQKLEPVLFLAGGPGQSASQGYLHIDAVFSDLAKNRDFYLVDQRGTGFSNPLACDAFSGIEEFFLTQNELEGVAEFMRQCLAALPGDPRYYTTSVAIRDFEQVRQALALPQWNLFGGSYGTRVALHYMRKYPEVIRASVIDSVVPPTLVLGAEIALGSQAALDHVFARCEKLAACQKRYPGLREKVQGLFTRLKESPQTITVENFRTGAMEEITFTHDHLLVLVRMYLYHTKTVELLPSMLYEAAVKGNFSSLARASNSIIDNMGQSMSLGMHNAVMCTEDVPYLTLDRALLEKHRATYMGENFVKLFEVMCAEWPVGEMDDDFKQVMHSAIPTLIISGEHDPITPPEYGDRVLKNLQNAKHLVLPGQGHFSSVEGCAPFLVEKFYAQASVKELDPDCLKRLQEGPLFMNYNGPSP